MAPLQTSIAVLSMSCRFPDAASPAELWENVMEGRRSFRAIPPNRLDIARYSAGVVGEADSITRIRAGLLRDWEFDRNKFRIPEKTFAAADLTHWLALELATKSIEEAGGADRLDRLRTAVVVGNTLTGEFSRAALLRLRLPFLEDLLDQAAEAEGLPDNMVGRLRNRFAAELRSLFSDPNEDSLAGGLANTIAGRIANHFDLRGGAYSVDGACASSLVALADAANLLASEQADAVVVAAVDLSLDPFELVGFSRNGALAVDEMRVFDAQSNGFWPGEGGACAVLMRENDARRRDLPMLAVIRGWGLSTDGAGGLTRPSSEGQLSAYRRAYEMSAIDPADIAFVEAHGTGTAVGDPIEVRALAALRAGSRTSLPIGSIKANIGHTKAAAGFAGLIKAIEALRHGIVPTHVGCLSPHPVFAEVDYTVHPALTCETIDRRIAVAGVSSFGFGGINAHVVIEQAATAARPISLPKPALVQDAELFLFSADGVEEIISQLVELEQRAPALSMAEFTDAAARTASILRYGSIRLAIVASDAAELANRLVEARKMLIDGTPGPGQTGIFIGWPHGRPRIGFIFPGQAAPCRPDGGIWRRRFADAAELVARMPACAGNDRTATEIAQPVIVASSLAALRVLQRLDIAADVATGHSLGEIGALAWAGVLNHTTAIDLARARGSAMARFGVAGGAMLRVNLSAEDAERILHGCGTVVACQNGRLETVVAGSASAVAAAAERCSARNIETSRLSVSHAFHSPDMEAAAFPLASLLAEFQFKPPTARVISTITGAALARDADLARLLVDQLTKPVLFDRALEEMAARADILVEVGPGQGLTRLAHGRGLAALPVDALGGSLKPLLATVGALFVAGVDVRAEALFEDRCIRSFNRTAVSRFIESPCAIKRANETIESGRVAPSIADEAEFDTPAQGEPLAVVLSVIAAETGLDVSRFGADDRFLDAFHLNSLAVARIVRKAAKALNAPVPSVPTEFANGTPRLLAEALAELRELGGAAVGKEQRIGGVRPWVRFYAMQWETTRGPAGRPSLSRWLRVTIGEDTPLPGNSTFDTALLILIEGPFGMETAKRLVALVGSAAGAGVEHLALCHSELPIAAFARSVATERHFRSVRVIDRAGAGSTDPRLDQILSADIEGYYEVRFAEDGALERPLFAPSSFASCPLAAITANDVVVIIGGAKGIAAECALRAANSGCAIVLVGRSAADDPQVAATQDRARRNGVRCLYVRADVRDSAALIDALASATSEFGPATVLLYAAGVNEPRRLTELDAEITSNTLSPKTLGLESALRALGPQLRYLVTFGSIIGRIGFEGEAHYALANAMQTAATEAWASAKPHRSALAIEWSLWGGVGMGERLGTIERLGSLGVDAISVDDALDAFDRLLAENAVGTVVVTGRFGPPPALSLGAPELPLLRFADAPKVHFPGVELVVETSLSRGRDPYLGDHLIDGLAVLPGVMSLEAMAQIASILTPLQHRIRITNVTFERAISVAADGELQIRIAALCTKDGVVEVSLFAEDDDFAAPCIRAAFSRSLADPAPAQLPPVDHTFSAAPLYGPLFFGGDRFRRVDRLGIVTSRRVSAQLRLDNDTKWFGSYEPDRLVLWDPGLADATLHALQVTIPHMRILPVSAGQIEIDMSVGPPAFIWAVEKKAVAGTYTFEITATDAKGRTAYRWTNVVFRAVGRIDLPAALEALRLIRPYLERVAREALGDDTIEVAVVRDCDSSRDSRRATLLGAFELNGTVERRADGRPIRREGDGWISFAHSDAITLAVTAKGPVGCDIETVHSADMADIDAIRRHVAFEVCRKLGRRPGGALRAPTPGAITVVGDVDLVVVDLPNPVGCHIVAFGSVRRPVAKPSPLSVLPINEPCP